MQSRFHSRLATALLALAVMTLSAHAQTYTVVVDFFGQLPELPAVGQAAVQGRDGNLYGTSVEGGTSGLGTVFKITPSGTLTTLYSFDGTVGEYPYGGLTLGTDGNFYGTANRGGSAGFGSVYKINPDGVITSIHTFTNDGDGTNPEVAPVLGSDGNFYGTSSGIDVSTTEANSTIYKVTPTGVFTTLHTLNPSTDGSGAAYLILGADGDFYGTASYGGVDSWGTLFKVTPTGAFTMLHAFTNGTDGTQPGSLAQAANGTLYGVTYLGGSGSAGVIFKTTTTGILTVLYSLNISGLDGRGITGTTTLGTDGNFYNVAYSGGANDGGTLFKVSPAGAFTKVLDFNGADVGSTPETGLLQATSGLFYGSTENGGTGNAAVFYSLNESLSPFAALVSLSGKEGARIGILGQGFTSSSIVKFAGVQATTIIRTGTTFITATVPPGALTGSVTVQTGSTTLTSDHNFAVSPTFPTFSPSSGPVGTLVTLTGSGLMQTSKVTFNGLSATFTVVSDTEVTATVPTGATTGKIVITTKGGKAQSAANFTVN